MGLEFKTRLIFKYTHLMSIKNKKMNGYLHGGVVILKFMNKLVHCIMTLSPLWQVQTNTIKIRKGFHEYNS